jgi:hypothetical protein
MESISRENQMEKTEGAEVETGDFRHRGRTSYVSRRYSDQGTRDYVARAHPRDGHRDYVRDQTREDYDRPHDRPHDRHSQPFYRKRSYTSVCSNSNFESRNNWGPPERKFHGPRSRHAYNKSQLHNQRNQFVKFNRRKPFNNKHERHSTFRAPKHLSTVQQKKRHLKRLRKIAADLAASEEGSFVYKPGMIGLLRPSTPLNTTQFILKHKKYSPKENKRPDHKEEEKDKD